MTRRHDTAREHRAGRGRLAGASTTVRSEGLGTSLRGTGRRTRPLGSATGTLHDLRVAEVVKQDIHLDEGGAITYRTKLQLSFKYEPEH